MKSKRFWACCATVLAVAVLPALTGCTGTGACEFTNDGECDDGRDCAETALCDFGTDEADCSFIDECDPANSCVYAFDGECDDGSPGSVTDLCEPGTDDSDCF